jgi:hypothetical protein
MLPCRPIVSRILVISGGVVCVCYLYVSAFTRSDQQVAGLKIALIGPD